MENKPQKVTVATIGRFLFGNRQAICDIARCKRGLLIGFLLTLSAGFAREYDAEYLIAEPWHILISAEASLLASFVLFVLLFAIAKRRKAKTDWFFKTYLRFLTLFWMTAPLAWIYAIPVERFLEPLDAIVANLWFLKIVSFWRVVLMIRIVMVFFGGSLFASAIAVIFFADLTMQIALGFAPFPILHIMGGVHLSDRAEVMNRAVIDLAFFGTMTMPIWFVAVIIVLLRRSPEWKTIESMPDTNMSRGLKRTAITSVLIWMAVLPFTQAEQHCRYRTDSMMAAGKIGDGLVFMSKHEQSDFPPLWEPLPRPDFREYKPDLTDIMLTMDETNVATWVKNIYKQKFENYIGIGRSPYTVWRWNRSKDEVETIIDTLEQLADGPDYASKILTEMSRHIESWDVGLVERLEDMAGQKRSD